MTAATFAPNLYRAARVSSLSLPMLLAGCAGLFQAPDQVLVRLPGDRVSQPPEPMAPHAKRLYVYAAMSANIYQPDTASQASTDVTAGHLQAACAPRSQHPLPLGGGWRLVDGFPKRAVLLDDEFNVRAQLWEYSEGAAPVSALAVAFRGTQANHGQDWWANLRWFFRGRDDHYTRTDEEIALNLQAHLQRGLDDGRISPDATLVATGHSLGGGLAQHLAYAYRAPLSATGSLPRASAVVVFNSSPVTGWSDVDKDLRQRNAAGLPIERAFEYGEILSYLRTTISVVLPPSSANPAISGLRFNVKDSWNPFSNHSMRLLACAMARQAFPEGQSIQLAPLAQE